MKVMNLGLMTNPFNWITVAIWLFVFAMVIAAAGVGQSAPSNTRAQS